MKTRFNLWHESFSLYFNRLVDTYKKQIFHRQFNFLYKTKKLRAYNKIQKSRHLRDDSSIIYPQWKYTAQFHEQLKDSVHETKDMLTNISQSLDYINQSLEWCKNFYVYLNFYYGNIFSISHTNTNYMRWGKPITVHITSKPEENNKQFMIEVWPERYLQHVDDKNLMRFYAYQYINSIIKKQNKHFETNLIYLILQFVI
jgi:hypothetical protein